MVKKETYKLTAEGEKYLKEGLPEVRLLKILKKSISVTEAQKKVDNFSIALQWAKKNGWVKVESGKIIIVEKPEASDGVDILKKASAGDLTEKQMSMLLSRKLIKKGHDISKKAEKLIGKQINNLTPALIKTGLWKKIKLKPYNVLAKGKTVYPGKRQPYNQFLLQVRRKLMELGFKEMTGPMIETEFWNFDALFQAQNHPSRDWTQTYTLKYPKTGKLPNKKTVSRVKAAHENGWKTGSTGWGYDWDHEKASQLMPRAHDTAISPRYLSGFSGKVEIPGKYFNIVRCFRPDVIDATHGVEFNQMGGFVVAEDLNFKSLLGILKEIATKFTGADKVRFYTDYYPFTEPSVQVSAKHPEMGWVELAGAGIFRSELTEPLGIKEPVIAWGFGIDRLAMHKLGISDIRYLFSQNLEWLRNSKILR